MSDQWTEGSPTEDGYYACFFAEGSQMVDRHMWRKDGKFYHSIDGVMSESTGTYQFARITKHIRLPEPVKPLEPLRRFRAKYSGKPCVGVERRNYGENSRLYIEYGEVGWTMCEERNLTELEWIKD